MFYLSLIIIPIVTALAVMLSFKSKNLREAVSVFGALATLVVFSRGLLSGLSFEYLNLLNLSSNLSISFKADSSSVVFAGLVIVLWLLTTVYAIGYMNKAEEKSLSRFFTFFSFSIAATLGVAFSANLFTLWLCYEVLTFSTYPLVTHHQDEDAKKAGIKYFGIIFTTSIFLVLPALVIIANATGGTDFGSLAVLGEALPKSLIVALFFMLLFGFSKAALIPFHSWLPGAMVAPTPVSALLHAVAVVKVGVFSVYRVADGVFGFELLNSLSLGSLAVQDLAVYLVAFTIVFSAVTALFQDNLKRRLAFSTISQLAYIVLGVVLFNEIAKTGAILHILAHGFGKITLFFCAGAIYLASGKKYISELRGIAYKMPYTMAAFSIGTLSIVGFPLTGSFFSKFYLLRGSLAANQTIAFTVYLLGSFLAACYLLPVIFSAYSPISANNDSDEVETTLNIVNEAPLFCVVPLLITAAISVIMFFTSSSLVNFLNN